MISAWEFLIFIFCGSISLAIFSYYFLSWRFDYWKKRGVAGPKPVFFFGNIKSCTLRKKQFFETYKGLYDAFPNEKVVGIYCLRNPCVLIRDLEVLKHIMIKDFDNFVDRGLSFGEGGLGRNLFNSDGDTWRVLRTRLSPIFTTGKLKGMLPLIDQTGDKFIDYLDSIVHKSSDLNIYPVVQKFTLASIGECAFGISINMHEVDEIFQKMDQLIFGTNYAFELDIMFPGLLKKFGMAVFPKIINNFFYDLVQRIFEDRNGVPSSRNDFMDLLIELKTAGTIHGSKKFEADKDRSLEISDDVMAAQAFVFYAAGYETSASTVAFLLHEIAHNQDIQARVIKEIDDTLAKTNGQLTFDTLKDLTYTNQVFEETLRMHPIVDPLVRTCQAKYKIPGTNIELEEGMKVFVSVNGIHYDEKYYPNPLKFDPDRFLPENVKERHPCANFSFGVGPRNCIGMRFAQVQSRIVLVKFLSKYRVEPSSMTPHKITYDPQRALRYSKGGIYVKIIPRN